MPSSLSQASDNRLNIFFMLLAKVLTPLDLRRGDMVGPAQNIDSQSVAGKILRNKELALRSKSPSSRAGMNSRKVRARIFPILHCAFFSVKVVRHTKQILAVEKRRWTLQRRVPKSPDQAELGPGTTDLEPISFRHVPSPGSPSKG